MPAIGVGTTDPGKTLAQVSTSQVFLDDFIHHRPKEPVLFLTMLIIAGLERFIVVVLDLPQGRSVCQDALFPWTFLPSTQTQRGFSNEWIRSM